MRGPLGDAGRRRSAAPAGGGCGGRRRRAEEAGVRPGQAHAVEALDRRGTSSRNAYCGLSATWATVCTSPKAMWRRWASWNSSPESLVRQKRLIAFITRGIWPMASSSVSFDSSAPSGSPSSAIHSNSSAGLRDGRDVARRPSWRWPRRRRRASAANPGAAPAAGWAAGRGTTTGRTGSRSTTSSPRAATGRRAGRARSHGPTYTPASPQMHAMSRAEVEVLAAPRAHGLVRRTRDAEHAAHGAGHEIAGLPVGPWAGAAERA